MSRVTGGATRGSKGSLAYIGPTYEEMLHPNMLPEYIRVGAAAARDNELDSANLFNISWRRPDGGIRHLLLPKELTGANANILVLLGCEFPSGSHKVGPAYATLMEGELAGEITPERHTIVGPSTGNFGIGVAYISRLKGYPAIVIMPEQMSAERYARIRHYGAELDLTPGSESDVILVLERTKAYKTDPRYKILAQFELFPNYRFHRYVTGNSAIEVACQYGNGSIAAFVSAPGSAGTLAAGDEIKAQFASAVVCAVEPRECSTLFNNGRGAHRIEGIGDKMVSLIHNVLTTDYVLRVHDDDCVVGLDLIQRRASILEQKFGMTSGSLAYLRGVFGVSAICNILGAIRLARFLGMDRDDNVVTIATDGFDRYPSVLADLERRMGVTTLISERVEAIFREGDDQEEILDVRTKEQKERLFRYKEETWTNFGYSLSYLTKMKDISFWENEYDTIRGHDLALARARML
jgi:cysteine synthase A